MTAERLERREVALGVGMAGTSGAAVLAYAFGPVPMSFTVPFVVLPSASLLVGLVLLRQRLYRRLHRFSTLLTRGAAVGLLATLVYDAVRPLIVVSLGLSFDPYRAMPIYGQLITGMQPTVPMSIATGWLYHVWNGLSFGMMFALVRPAGGIVAGFVWAMLLQAAMMAAYPAFLAVRLADPGFLATGLIGHALWGIVLGAGLREWAHRA